MSAVTHYFFAPVYNPRNSWSVIEWWEARRAAYNLSVGAVGLMSLAVLNVFALLPPHPAHLRIPWGGVGVYAVLANLCYTLGPVADLAIRRCWGNVYAAVGPALFRYGFVFSIGLTLLPMPLALLSWAFRVLQILF